jgi:hypothetical protein
MSKRRLNEQSTKHLSTAEQHLADALALVDRARGYSKTDPTLQMMILADLRGELLEIKILLIRARLNEAEDT